MSDGEDAKLDSDVSSNSDPVEALAHGRAKRSTAGNRLSTLLGQEETGDDDVTLLFQEDEEDIDEEFEEGFPSDEGGGESSSSEDEDEQAGDDLEGEEQLRKEERERNKAQKRKADQKIIRPRPAAKRVRISEPTSRDEGQPVKSNHKRKKSDRTSWVLHDGDGSVRTSSRTLSIQNKERTQASLKESEAKRSRQLAVMEAAQKKREAERKGPMTQEDRLKEAEEVERQNSKSLNKWEEMETERIKKQKQKLEALQNRKIEGPMIRWWSGPAEWVGEKLVHIGPRKAIGQVSTVDQTSNREELQTTENNKIDVQASAEAVVPNPVPQPVSSQVSAETSNTAHTSQAPSKSSTELLDGIEHFAYMPENTQPSAAPAPTITNNSIGPLMTPYPVQQQPVLSEASALDRFRAGAPVAQSGPISAPAPTAPPPLLPLIKAMRSTISLKNFDEVVKRSQDAKARIVFGLNSSDEAKSMKPAPPALCAITSQIAKYRDPLSGLPYRGRAEFKKIRSLPGLGAKPEDEKDRMNQARWSEALGAWIGTAAHPAKGVPESFLSGISPSSDNVLKAEAQTQSENEAAKT